VPAFPGSLVMAIGEVIRATAYVFMFAIFIRIILSWMNQSYGNNPIIGVLHALTEPLMAPARRILPPMGGLDLSPILVFIAIYFVLLVIAQPIYDTGLQLAGLR
jgi:YggT family protein